MVAVAGKGLGLVATRTIRRAELVIREQPLLVKVMVLVLVVSSASKSSIRRFVITEKPPTRAFSWLKAPTIAFTFKTLLTLYCR